MKNKNFIYTKPLEKAIKVIVKYSDPDKIILFGSQATGTAGTDSDYDFLVIVNTSANCRAIAQKIYMKLDNIGAPVDIIVTDAKRFEKNKDDPYMIYSEAATHGKIVYERNSLIGEIKYF